MFLTVSQIFAENPILDDLTEIVNKVDEEYCVELKHILVNLTSNNRSIFTKRVSQEVLPHFDGDSLPFGSALTSTADIDCTGGCGIPLQ